jgi:hypothetical protein
MRLLTTVVLLLSFVIAMQPAFAETTPQELDELRKNFLVPASKDAKTAELGLSAEATRCIDLWLDYSRVKYSGKPNNNRQFMGVAHELVSETDGKFTVGIGYVNVVIDIVELTQKQCAEVVYCWDMAGAMDKISVASDDKELLRSWLFLLGIKLYPMLSASVKKAKADDYEADKWSERGTKALEFLLAEISKTEPSKRTFAAPGTKDAIRATWIAMISTLAGAESTKMLLDLRKKFMDAKEQADADIITLKIIALGSEDSWTLVRELIASGTDSQLTNSLWAVPDTCPADILDSLTAKYEGNTNPGLRRTVGMLMEKVGAAGNENSQKARDFLYGQFTKCNDSFKYELACSSFRAGCRQEELKQYFTELKAKLEAENPNDGRINFIKQMIEQF